MGSSLRSTSFRHRLVILTVALFAIAGCSGGGEEGGSAETKTVTRLIYGVAPPTQEAMNPNRDMQPQDEFQLKPMYENLIGSEPKTGRWIPMLAERWEIQGNELRMFLRKGVKFHKDKGEFTAADVEYSYKDLIEPAGALSGVAEVMRNGVERLEIVNDHEIVWHLEAASYKFLEGLSYGAAGMAIKSKRDAESRPGSPIGLDGEPLAGTGPYQFKERSAGRNVVFERVPYQHWRQQASFQELEYRYIAENSTRLSALQAGEIHVTELPTELTKQAAGGGAKVIKAGVPGRRIGMSLLGCYYKQAPKPDQLAATVFTSQERKYPDSPMCDLRVRRAINKAIDREALNQAFYGGAAERMFMWYWQPELPGFNPAWQQRWDEVYGYDPEAARGLLQEAGYGPGTPLKVEVLGTPNSGGAESADVSEAVAGMLSDVGIEAPILSMDAAQHSARREAREFQSAIEFDSTSSEPITGFEPQGYANQASGRAIEDVQMDTEYERVLLELDPDRQAQLWQAFGDKVFDMVQHVPLLRISDEVVVDPAVVDGYTFPGAMMSAPHSFVEYITPARAS
jgi:peptide/nickel transport system substrate-binding protein